jgi:hypothetical protein
MIERDDLAIYPELSKPRGALKREDLAIQLTRG